MELTLRQSGAKATGNVKVPGGPYAYDFSGPILGTITGDVLSFTVNNGRLQGEVVVALDEMSGTVTMTYTRFSSSTKFTATCRTWSASVGQVMNADCASPPPVNTFRAVRRERPLNVFSARRVRAPPPCATLGLAAVRQAPPVADRGSQSRLQPDHFPRRPQISQRRHPPGEVARMPKHASTWSAREPRSTTLLYISSPPTVLRRARCRTHRHRGRRG